ncbi:MAG: hypothetical protein WA093_00270 [Minisyncoccales bacterium]
MILRKQLETINRGTLKYPLQIAEKDYMLALVLQIISESTLGKTLIFKGGTVLHHCYLDKYKFDLQEMIGYIKQKEIRKPIAKSKIKNNLKIVHTQREEDLSRIYYSRPIADEDIEKMIRDLPFDEIT